jgi:hypothetical protein
MIATICGLRRFTSFSRRDDHLAARIGPRLPKLWER